MAQTTRRFMLVCNMPLLVIIAHVANLLAAAPVDHRIAMNQKVARPSLPSFRYAKGHESGTTHHLKDNGIYWSIVSQRAHPNHRNTEGDIVVLDDGALLLAWSDFSSVGWGDNSPCRISMRRSTDGGWSWSPIEILQEQIGSNVMSVSLLRTGKGAVLFTFLSKDAPHGGWVHYVRRSTDGGKTFGAPIPMTAGYPRRVANNDRFLEVHDPQGKYGDRGRIVLACTNHSDALTGIMVYSDDDGLTWKTGNNAPFRPGWGTYHFDEPGIVELSDGRFWSYARTTLGFYSQAWSVDRGLTWSMPEKMVLKSIVCPLTGEMIPETPYTKKMGWAGHILLTFTNHDFQRFPRKYKYTARTPLDAAISRDGANTWSLVRTIEEDPTVQYGYSSITFLEDEEVGMRVLLTTHVQPIPGYKYRPHDLKFISIPLKWFYEKADNPRHGIDFADEERHTLWDKPAGG